ncbi:conjugal transfer protein TraS [Sphaerisporangium siamense]|uniref:S-DNA-T family DNA segregation ATPase FtsK/SpoIIIE n=1 Tax=Sphaerisporangium siamense TaxID=795645 RepID=A0A7W7GB53_9ACTN|nr:FtsK/SpoIIIE domain-containing protein [Sphaerisporangium siamense]MBB4700661.1 S-DNA-T family DNA segregation ATPase FtsK/SpoIIIE [Sphaerisporangium siamense]GII89572.1 conjugal transfer protein TraS [Sphaerisporangium siamense]
MPDLLHLLLGILAYLAALLTAAWTWRHWHYRSYWLTIGYTLTAIGVRVTWRKVALGCGLTKKQHRWWFTVVPRAVVSTGLVKVRRRVQRVAVDVKPWMWLPLPTRYGWRVTVRLLEGQVPGDYADAAERLAHSWGVHAVRVSSPRPGRVVLAVTIRDPLVRLDTLPASGELLTVIVGKLETGGPWVIDFRTVPHWLNAGATQSGKSNLANVLIVGLAPQPVALVGFDLKGGVEFASYGPRLSALATDRAESLALLDDLVAMMLDRMGLCRAHGARNIWQLPAGLRPVPVVVLVDELAELYLMAGKSEKDEVARTSTALLRIAQLGRAFGIYLFLCGQRIGSDLGPGVTALRAQCSGRICHRVNDPETATMTLGDLDPAALLSARAIPAETPGVAIVASQDGQWYRARSFYVAEHIAEHAARIYAHLTPSWADLTTGAHRGEVTETDIPVLLDA